MYQNSTETNATETKRNSYIRIVKSDVSNETGIAILIKEKENKQMNDFNKRNYYALFISIVKNETAKEALSDMGICPDNVKEEE